MISATVIAHSISPIGKEIITMELEYPRFIHSEFMTHRVFSRNAASSRAIPVAQVLRQVWNNPASPVHWGRNQGGMQAQEELPSFKRFVSHKLWNGAAKAACVFAWGMMKVGLHKQVANRILEPFQLIKVVVTSTEWINFFELRDHPDAQPEIHELAGKMRRAIYESKPMQLEYGEWHLPYVLRYRDTDGKVRYGDGDELSIADAKKVSASCCAQVSYRKLDDSLDKALKVYDRLLGSKPLHASPFEHQAMPALENSDKEYTGNFNGWLQHRKLIEQNAA